LLHAPPEDVILTTLKLHYDGWLALPAGLRQRLGLGSGARLEADLVDGAIVLRPAAKGRRQEVAADKPVADASPMPAAAADAAPAKRKPGRPRKVAIAGELAPAAAPKKARGRPRKAAAPAPEPGPAVLPVAAVGAPKLVKKADLQPKVEAAAPAAPAANLVSRARGDAGSRFEERRPFRHVEVRKLGPGQGHNRPRRLHPGSAG
jgi:bifunctional DNA-binding transcriptional regulator/antitoxin component of YhaV-PrlF toxin-antitoxin module